MELQQKIEAATELFKMKVENFDWVGLLLPPKDGSIFAYDRPALGIKITIREHDGRTEFLAVIKSSDDSGCTIFGPKEEKLKALDRYSAFRIDFIKTFGIQCPTKEQLTNFCKLHGVFPDYY